MLRNFSIFLLLASFASLSHAAHPLITDDPGTQGPGKHQLEINTDWTRHLGKSGHEGTLTYTYGTRADLDLFIDLPQSFLAQSGMRDVVIGTKWRWLENGPASLALKPSLSLPTGDANKGLGNGRASGTLLLIGAYEIEDWELLANLGVSVNRYQLATDRNSNHALIWRASAAVLYTVNEQWRLAADAGLVRNRDKTVSTSPAYFLAGVIYSPTQQLDLDAGMKWGLNCKTCSEQTARQFGVGLTLRF